jgi:arylsulfatase A-like enzyme
MKKILVLLAAAAAAWPVSSTFFSQQGRLVNARPRNIVILVFDGLRAGSVNATDAPTMDWIRSHGVSFVNSHSLFPTFTTANASAIATGHYFGDTGDFSNTFYIGQPIFLSGNFGRAPGTYSPYIENDSVLGDLDSAFHGNYLNEETLLGAARAQGFHTAAVGKMGPTAIQDVSQLNPVDGKFATPQTVIIDDGTGTADGVPLDPRISSALLRAGLPTTTPPRNQPTGNNTTPGTLTPNTEQQAYFANAVTRAILPLFKKSGKPFVLLYWSRDPDGTQHYQGDSLNKLVPGINGPTSKAGLRNADNNLKQILDAINSDAEMAADTDIFITADHGFATISKHDIDADGHGTASYSAKWLYKDAQGRQEVNDGFLPQGFLAIDIAHELGLPLFDPDVQINSPDGKKIFQPVDPVIPQQRATVGQRPSNGNGLIGGTGRIAKQTDAKVVVSANGGSDLIYLPTHDPATMEKIVAFLARQDYVGGIFADDDYGKLPGALPLSTIRLVGSSKLPRPSIVVAFKTFATDSRRPLMTAVQITDYNLQHGQGMHGSFGRSNTFNFMAAYGPDFKKQFVDRAPISNADIQPTLAKILGLNIASNGTLNGRILEEALLDGPSSVPSKRHVEIAPYAANGKATVLVYQRVMQQVYFDWACFLDKGASSQVMCP